MSTLNTLEKQFNSINDEMTIRQLLSRIMEEKGYNPANIPKIEGRTAAEMSTMNTLEKQFNSINDGITFEEIMEIHNENFRRN